MIAITNKIKIENNKIIKNYLIKNLKIYVVIKKKPTLETCKMPNWYKRKMQSMICLNYKKTIFPVFANVSRYRIHLNNYVILRIHSHANKNKVERKIPSQTTDLWVS